MYLGDFDPTGLHIDQTVIPEQLAKQNDNTPIVRLALTLEQTASLPQDYQRPKQTDPNFVEYVSVYGDNCWEVDALTPSQLQAIVANALSTYRPLEQIEQLRNRDYLDCRGLLDKLEVIGL